MSIPGVNKEDMDAIKEYVEQLEQNVAHLQEKCLLLETQKDIAKVKLDNLRTYTLYLETQLNKMVTNT